MDTTCISYRPGRGCRALKAGSADCNDCNFKKTREEQLAIQKKCATRLERLGIKYEPLIKE
ncbi:hypothetical protein ACGCUP_00940 [Eubacteriales bacterium KG125]